MSLCMPIIVIPCYNTACAFVALLKIEHSAVEWGVCISTGLHNDPCPLGKLNRWICGPRELPAGLNPPLTGLGQHHPS